MHESELQSENHRAHPLEWRSDSTCLLCLLEIISSEGCHRLKIHRRFALATLSQRLSPEPVVVSSSQLVTSQAQASRNRSLPRLLQKNRSIATRVLAALLGKLPFKVCSAYTCLTMLVPRLQMPCPRPTWSTWLSRPSTGCTTTWCGRSLCSSQC